MVRDSVEHEKQARKEDPVKIVDLQVTPIAFADPPLRSSYGLHAPYALRTVVELVGEDGLVGVSEAHGGEQTLVDFARARETVVGRDVNDLARMWLAIAGAFGLAEAPDAPGVDRSHTYLLPGEGRLDVPLRIYAAVEVAALDLIGKMTGTPVCELLGGRVRDEVPFSAYLFYKHRGGGGVGDDARRDDWGEALTPEALVSQATAMIEEYGFGSVKLKGGVFDPDLEIATMRALREALGPGVPLRIDPNAAWSVETSLRVGAELAGALEYLEDPTPGLAGMAAVRHGLRAAGNDLPLASNIAVTSFADVPETVRTDAAQVILGDHHYWGGPRAITQLGRLCETFGLGLSMHSNSHLGVSLLAMTHVAAATPGLTFACDTHYPWQHAEDEILQGGRVPIVNGTVRVPDQPGLGVELDRDAVARGRERYEGCGYRRRDDAAEMCQHVDPTWKRVVPAW
jgi:glucarate dehydratase